MQTLDVVFLILSGLLVLRGYLKGFTGEFFSIASFALAIMGGVLFFNSGAAFLRSFNFNMALFPEIVAFLIIFLIVFILGKVVENIVKDIINRLNLGSLDKFLGIFLGLAEAAALIVLFLFILMIQPLFDSTRILEESFFARLFLPLIRMGTSGHFRVAGRLPGILEGLHV